MMTPEEFLAIPILEILPQRPPFVMVSRLLFCDEQHTRTQLDIAPDNLFCMDNILQPGGLIENFAQTCAARIGYINKYILHRDICIGYIGGIQNLIFHNMPQAGQTIETHIDILHAAWGISLAHGQICDAEGNTLVEGDMKIVESEIKSNAHLI